VRKTCNCDKDNFASDTAIVKVTLYAFYELNGGKGSSIKDVRKEGEGEFCPMRTSAVSAWYDLVADDCGTAKQPGQTHLSSVWTILPFAGGQTQPQPNTHTRQLPPLMMPRMSRLAPLPYHHQEAALIPRILSCLSFPTCLTGCSRPLLTMVNLTSIFFRAIFLVRIMSFLARIKRSINIKTVSYTTHTVP